ncbi:MAG: hypothetical protein ACK41E_03725 [Deinococcales bacterium]
MQHFLLGRKHKQWFLALLLSLLSTPAVFAHAVAVNLDAFTEQSELVVLMNGVNGEPINQATIAYSLLSGSGEVSSAGLRYVADGEYRAKLPSVPKGEYTLKLRDTTFPQEMLEVASTVQIPLQNPVRMILPPSKVGQPDVTVLAILAALPILVALVALVLVLFSRPKPKPEVLP